MCEYISLCQTTVRIGVELSLQFALLCFSKPFKMYEMSDAPAKTIINCHTLLFIFYFTQRLGACDVVGAYIKAAGTVQLRKHGTLLPEESKPNSHPEAATTEWCVSGTQFCETNMFDWQLIKLNRIRVLSSWLNIQVIFQVGYSSFQSWLCCYLHLFLSWKSSCEFSNAF